MSTKLVLCGLGNPGEAYRFTRHNLGFRLLETLSESLGGKWSFPSDQYARCEARIKGRDCVLVKPLTYMNLSGEALEELGRHEEIAPSRLLVVCDDIALPLGHIRLRRAGSDGGHNGLKSVIQRLNTTRFPRLRLGIGPLPDGIEGADFVLSPFLESEWKSTDAMIRQAAKCVEVWAEFGVATAMNRFNTRVPSFGPEKPDPEPGGGAPQETR